jgi:exodeoxyribonuclease-3
MKIISFNINGLRSVLGKDKTGKKIATGETVIETLIKEQEPDIICLQEIRCSDNVNLKIINFEDYGYEDITLNCAEKKGYSGTAIFSKVKPLSIKLDFNNNEGRIITFEFSKFILINTYVPNAKPDLSRLDYRINTWEKSIRNYIKNLQNISDKHIVYCGDLNVAHNEIDVHSPTGAKNKHGFTLEERDSLQKLLTECKLIDSFRFIHPNEQKYSWFSNFAKSRERGKGWRIDYFLVSQKLKTKIVKADILSDYYGSDHVPIILEFKI